MKVKRLSNGYKSFSGFALLLGMFLLTGCGGGGGGGDGTIGTPGIGLSVSSIDFPNTVLDRTAYNSVTISSTGTATLRVGQITAPAEGFSFSGTCSNSSLAPGQSCVLTVGFTPTAEKAYAGSFTIPSNAGNVAVSVSGEGQSLNVTINSVNSSDWRTIRLIVSVADQNDNPIKNLVSQNFSLFEQGQPQPVFDLDGISQTPVSVALVLDYSGTIATVQADVENSARSFIELLADLDEAMVIKFSAEIQKMIDLTALPGGKNALLDAVSASYDGSTKGTLFYDAVQYAVNFVSDNAAAGHRKAVIVVSDGFDSKETGGPLSTATLQQVIDNAVAKGVWVYTIGFGDYLKPDIMDQLAQGTGGEYLETPDTAELENAYEVISGILDNQYELAFTTIRDDGSVNELTVEVVEGLRSGSDTVQATY